MLSEDCTTHIRLIVRLADEDGTAHARLFHAAYEAPAVNGFFEMDVMCNPIETNGTYEVRLIQPGDFEGVCKILIQNGFTIVSVVEEVPGYGLDLRV